MNFHFPTGAASASIYQPFYYFRSMEDKLTEFERAEYYKEQLGTAKFRLRLYCALWFGVGFAVARALYLTILKPC